jgi:hypothetical protein
MKNGIHIPGPALQVLAALALLAGVAIFVRQLPDGIRYLKMETM